MKQAVPLGELKIEPPELDPDDNFEKLLEEVRKKQNRDGTAFKKDTKTLSQVL